MSLVDESTKSGLVVTDAPKTESGGNNVPTEGASDNDDDDDDDDDAIIPRGEMDPVYEAKARVLNHAIQEIGLGTYQHHLFLVVSFGWASDNLWPIVLSLLLPSITAEFRPSHPALLALAQNIGLLAGAVFWGFGCDVFGRRWAFNLTLGITAVFGLAGAGAPGFAGLGVLAALWSFGVGGNLPVDSAVFLEFLPRDGQYLLTVLSVGWAVSQVVAGLVAWPLLGGFTCDGKEGEEECTRGENMGWRYFLITVGGLTMVMFVVRFLVVTVHESPKYLAARGEDEEAVRIVREVARSNGEETGLTVDMLKACEPEGYVARTVDVSSVVKRQLQEIKFDRVRTLFATKRLALSTSLIMVVWAFIGLGYPLYNSFLPFIQAARGADFGDGSTYLTYRNSLIIAVVGVPGALVGAYLIERPGLGRKGTLSICTVLTGVFLYGSTTAMDSKSLLGWNCAFSFASNVMYSVLYSYTPELFPTPSRGTGNALTATCNRIFGIMAPIVAMFGDLKTATPVYVSGALFIVSGILVLFLPFESRGKAAL